MFNHSALIRLHWPLIAYAVDILLNMLNITPDGSHQFPMSNYHTVIPFWKENIVPDLSVKCLNMYNIVQCISMWMMFIYSTLCNSFFLCGGCWIDCRLCHLLKRGCQNGEQLFTDVEECSAVSWFNCDVLLDQPTEVFVYSAVTSSWLILANCLF